MQRRARFAGITVVALLAFTGCAEDSDGSNGSGGNGGNGASDGPVTSVHITIEGDQVEPNGDQVEVPFDEPIELHVTADEAGELHIHTQPEQEIAYPAGESTHELTLDRPGVYEVESHGLDKIIMELEAS